MSQDLPSVGGVHCQAFLKQKAALEQQAGKSHLLVCLSMQYAK